MLALSPEVHIWKAEGIHLQFINFQFISLFSSRDKCELKKKSSLGGRNQGLRNSGVGT